MKAGFTFRATNPPPGVDENRHLWIILSDPEQFPDEVLTVFMTSLRPRMDQTCILEPGDHEFVQHRTTIAYGAAAVWTLAELEQALSDGEIRLHNPVDDALLRRIRALAIHSPRLQYAHQQIVTRQKF